MIDLVGLQIFTGVSVAWVIVSNYVIALKQKAVRNHKKAITGAPFQTYNFIHDSTAATSKYIMQQTMLRIKDPRESLSWYSRVLGMKLLLELHFPEYKFSLYFMGYCDSSDIPSVISSFHEVFTL